MIRSDQACETWDNKVCMCYYNILCVVTDYCTLFTINLDG